MKLFVQVTGSSGAPNQFDVAEKLDYRLKTRLGNGKDFASDWSGYAEFSMLLPIKICYIRYAVFAACWLAASVIVGCGGGSVAWPDQELKAPESLRSDETQDAFLMYENACNHHSSRGCAYLGYMYDNGTGVSVDIERAVSLFDLSCKQNQAYGCAYLGYMYRVGRGVVQNATLAAQLFKKACEGDSTEGCLQLGIMYKSGAGVPCDAAEAIRLFERACSRGEPLSCASLGYMYQYGEGVPADRAKARAFFLVACEQGNQIGCESAQNLERP